MTSSDRFLAMARDAQRGPLVFADAPAWLWSADGARLMWCNAAAAAVFGAASPAAAMAQANGARAAAGREIAGLFGRLPAGGAPQLYRLRALAPSNLGRPLTCACRRARDEDGGAAVLVTAAEPVKPALPLAERVRRTLEGLDDLAAFAPDGAPLHAAAQLEQAAEPDLVAQAMREGSAESGSVRVVRFGAGEQAVLVARFAQSEPEVRNAALAAEAASEAPSAAESETAAAEPASDTEDHKPALAMLKAAAERLVERRHPLRFVWSMNADGAFAIEPGEFTALAGAPTVAALGKPWSEVAATLGLDPEGRVGAAVAARDTWSGVVIEWPAEGVAETLPIMLSGLPVLGADRSFHGYRGFGVCRDIGRIAAVIAGRRAQLTGSASDVPRADPTPSPPDEPPPGKLPPDERPPDVFAPPGREARAPLSLVPTARNVVPLRVGMPAERRPTLNPLERSAFQEIARALGARVEGEDTSAVASVLQAALAPTESAEQAAPESVTVAETAPDRSEAAAAERAERAILDRLPNAVLAFRGDEILFANRALLEWTGMQSAETLARGGGLDALFVDPVSPSLDAAEPDTRPLSLRRTDGDTLPVQARLFTLTIANAPAAMLVLTRCERRASAAARTPPTQRDDGTTAELRAILDTATDGVIVLDRAGAVQSANDGAAALFGRRQDSLSGRPMLELFAPESRRAIADYVDRVVRGEDGERRESGCEATARTANGEAISLFVSIGRLAGDPPRLCAAFRNITPWKQAEDALTRAKREAERASSAKSEFLAKVSHEVRTPLNAIVGFSEIMMEERLGTLDDRYRAYARDIHTSGAHILSLLNDLLDLSKIEAGRLDLSFAPVDLNETMQQCVAIMQQEASRERIVIRTALASALPPVLADARSLRQILLNLLSNSIKFTGAGGQVILSTALSDAGEAVLRVRDTGIGMSESDIAIALEPFRQLSGAVRPNAVGAGLGLPLSKALAEANRAEFRIKSAVNSGTLVELLFPAARVLAT
jgi:PAS domain S-box-containing protein